MSMIMVTLKAIISFFEVGQLVTRFLLLHRSSALNICNEHYQSAISRSLTKGMLLISRSFTGKGYFLKGLLIDLLQRIKVTT